MPATVTTSMITIIRTSVFQMPWIGFTKSVKNFIVAEKKSSTAEIKLMSVSMPYVCLKAALVSKPSQSQFTH